MQLSVIFTGLMMALENETQLTNRYALVRDNKCVGIIRWDGDTSTWSPPEGVTTELLTEDANVNPNDIWDGTQWLTTVIDIPALE
jgi:hypothetical protein